MNAATTTTTTRPARFGLARTLRLGAARIGYETRVYFRAGDTVFFTFLFPVVLLGIFSVAFQGMGNVGTNPDGSGGISQASYYLPGMIAAGILLSGMQNLGVDIAMERGDGTLKRLAGTPLPVMSYFIGKMGQVLVTSAAQVIILMLLAKLAFGVELPSEPEKWLTFLWVYLLGIVTAAVLGIAISRLPRSGKSAAAVIIPPLLILQFISGVYLSFSLLPEWLQNVASVFPLKWIAQGMRAALLPESFASAEAGGTWDLAGVAIVLGIWLVVGLVVCRLTFRWIRKDS
ncbi:ABC transporter permease [Herbiconiux flava]|uniref:ABC-2 type transport system permease protein n=1 Tax=Herbiconiux flava TaxID=881268 RepID=A0A852SHG3_9MICO|nr:ABC transporter permease [Herbiconiux flava]NYD69074.1 ABC-2 type transport system permease protein [Herbiconiux flava]GLK15822.1 transport permease protein [Herbiconiux flava]